MSVAWRRRAISLLLGSAASDVFGGQELLPRGIGLYSLGYRRWSPQSETYDASGDKVALGDKFHRDFDGPSLIDDNGALQPLAAELQRFDGKGVNGGLLDALALGILDADVNAQVSAQIFGLAYGLTDHLTIFAGIPWVSAQVDTELKMTGGNNADAIKQSLGAAAYQELSAGLDRASRLSVADVEAAFADAGYEPVEHWSRRGVGDARFGLKTGAEQRLGKRFGMGHYLTASLVLPTGYVEEPQRLTDVSFGRGCYSLGLQLDEKARFAKRFFVGGILGYTENFPMRLRKRVPVGEERLVNADREIEVNIKPGPDTDVAATTGLSLGPVDASYRYGVRKHLADRYRGDLEGNYDRLAAQSATEQQYQALQLSASTVDAYRRGSFSIPFVATLGAFDVLGGRNAPAERYFELSLTSFFGSPKERRETKADGRRRGKSVPAHH